MCGRFSLTAQQEILVKHFGIEQSKEYKPRYNIAPTQQAAIILDTNPQKMQYATWGLIPHWAKDDAISGKLINARVEGIGEKPSFRKPFASQHCLVLTDGFYEWKKATPKIPFRIERKDKQPFAFAGLYEENKEKQLISFTIITCPPNAVVAKIHDRMPVILQPQQYSVWLQTKDKETSLSLLQPCPDDMLYCYAVSHLVNSPSNDSPEVLTPLTTLV